MFFNTSLGFGNRTPSTSRKKTGNPDSGLRGRGPNVSEQGTNSKNSSHFSLFRKQPSYSTVGGSVESASAESHKKPKVNPESNLIPQNAVKSKDNILLGFFKKAKTKISSKSSILRNRSNVSPSAQSEVKPQILVSSKQSKHKLHLLPEATGSNVLSPAHLNASKQSTSIVDTKSNVDLKKATSHLSDKTRGNNAEGKSDSNTSSSPEGYGIKSSHFWTRMFSKPKSRKGKKAAKTMKSKTGIFRPKRSKITKEPETHEDDQPKKVNSTKSKICASSFETKSGTENLSWVQKLCAFATKTRGEPAQTMIVESQQREKKSTKISSFLKQNGEQKSSSFPSIPILNTVIDRVADSHTLLTAPVSSAFHASSPLLSLPTKRTLFKLTGKMFKSSIGVTSACTGTTAAAGVAILTGDFSPKLGCTGMEEVCKSVCFLGSQTFDIAESWVLEASDVFSGLRPHNFKKFCSSDVITKV